MATIAELVVKLVGDIGGFTSSMGKAAEVAQSAGSRVGGALGDIAKSAAGFVVGGAINAGIGALSDAFAGLKSAMIDGNAEFERYETQFGVLLGSADAAKKRLEELALFGAKTPFELPEVVRADKILQGFGLHAVDAAAKFGMSGAEIRTVAGDVASGTGAKFEEIAGYLGKFSSGATGEAISRFQELGIVTRAELAGMGLEFSKSGQLLSPLDKSMTVLLGAMKTKYGGMMDAQSSTFEGMQSNLQDWIGNAGRIMGAPIFDALKGQLGGLLETLNSPAVQEGLTTFATGIATVLSDVIAWVTANWPAIQATITTVFNAVIGWVTANWPAIQTVIETVFNAAKTIVENVLVPAFNVIVAAAQQVVAWLQANWPAIQAIAEGVFAAVKGYVDTVLVPAFNFIVAQAQKIITWLQTNWPLIRKTAETVFNAIQTVITTVFNAVRSVVETVWPIIQTVVETAINAVLGVITTVMNIINGDWAGAWNAIKATFEGVWNGISSFLTGIWNAIKGTVLDGINAVIGYINNSFIDPINAAIRSVNAALGTAIGQVQRLQSIAGSNGLLPDTEVTFSGAVGNASGGSGGGTFGSGGAARGTASVAYVTVNVYGADEKAARDGVVQGLRRAGLAVAA